MPKLRTHLLVSNFNPIKLLRTTLSSSSNTPHRFNSQHWSSRKIQCMGVIIMARCSITSRRRVQWLSKASMLSYPQLRMIPFKIKMLMGLSNLTMRLISTKPKITLKNKFRLELRIQVSIHFKKAPWWSIMVNKMF